MDDRQGAEIDPGQGVIDQGVVSGYLEGELDDGRAARRHADGLDIVQGGVRQGGVGIDAIHDLADQMQAGGLVGTADPEIEAGGVAHPHPHATLARQAAHRAVHHVMRRPLLQKPIQILDQTALAVRLGVDFALHDIEFMIDRRQSAFGLHQDQAVHAVGDVLGRHRLGAMIDIEARRQGLEAEAGALAGIDPRDPAPASRPGHGVQIDIVHHLTVGGVGEGQFDPVADAHP